METSDYVWEIVPSLCGDEDNVFTRAGARLQWVLRPPDPAAAAVSSPPAAVSCPPPPPSFSCCSELPPKLQLLTAGCSVRVQPAAVTSLLLHALLQLLQHPHHTHPTLNIGGKLRQFRNIWKKPYFDNFFKLYKWYSGKVFWTPWSTWSDVVVAPNTKTPDFYRWLDLRRCSLVLVLVRGRNLNIPSGSHLRLTYNTKLSTIHVSAFHKTSFIFFSI